MTEREQTIWSHLFAFVAGAGACVLLMLTLTDTEIEQKKKELSRRPDSYYKPAVNLIKCDKGAVQEVARICRARTRMEIVK